MVVSKYCREKGCARVLSFLTFYPGRHTRKEIEDYLYSFGDVTDSAHIGECLVWLETLQRIHFDPKDATYRLNIYKTTVKPGEPFPCGKCGVMGAHYDKWFSGRPLCKKCDSGIIFRALGSLWNQICPYH